MVIVPWVVPPCKFRIDLFWISPTKLLADDVMLPLWLVIVLEVIFPVVTSVAPLLLNVVAFIFDFANNEPEFTLISF